jgi:CDP-glucose 4,6-dehydratase
MRSIILGKKLKIRNPYAIRPWQHVLEPLSGYLTLCEALSTRGVSFGEAWNFGPDDNESKNVEWITETLCRLWGPDASYELDKDSHPHEANHLRLDCSKAKTLLGWHQKWNIETTLEKIVEWNKAFMNKAEMRTITIRQIEQYFLTNS